MKKPTVAFCLPQDVKDWLKKKSERDRLSMSSYLTQLISKIMRSETNDND